MKPPVLDVLAHPLIILPYSLKYSFIFLSLLEIYQMKPGSVLLVEDDPLIACQITSVIEELGHTAIVVQEPRAALRLLQDDEPDVIILSSYCSVERSRNMVLLLKYLLQGKTGMLLLTGARRKDMNEAWPSGERFSMLFKPFTIHQIKEQLLRLLKRDIACSIQSS